MKKEDTRKLINLTYFKSIVGSLHYLTSTRPYIVYEVGIISRFMEKPNESHLQVTKRILRYVSGTHDHEIFYPYFNNFSLVGYTDNDNKGDVETGKSITGYVFLSWNISILMAINETISCSIINYRS